MEVPENVRVVTLFTEVSDDQMKELFEVFEGMAEEHIKHFGKSKYLKPFKRMSTNAYLIMDGRNFKLTLKMIWIINKKKKLELLILEQNIEEITLKEYTTYISLESQNPDSGWKDI